MNPVASRYRSAQILDRPYAFVSRVKLRGLIEGLIDLVLPPVCLACDGLIASGDSKRLVCRRCRTQLRPAPPPLCERCGAPRLITGRAVEPDSCQECAAWPAELRSARSAYLMHPPADRIVHQIKYRGWSALATMMGDAMAQAWLAAKTDGEITAIIAVPTTESRKRERGYNQAELLARAVARALGRDCDQLLDRTNSTGTQTTLQPAARGANVAGTFRVSAGAEKRVADAHILIVDDVLTTGATTIECTQTLLAAGARATSVLTFARAFDTRRLLGT